MSFPRYPKYKASGVEWLGEVPEHWEVVRLGTQGKLYGGLTGKVGADFTDEGLNTCRFVPFTNILNNVVVDHCQLSPVQLQGGEMQNEVLQGDLLFLMSSEDFDYLGFSAVVRQLPSPTYLNSFCKGFRPNGRCGSSEFLNYFCRSTAGRALISQQGFGFTRINLRTSALASTPIPSPPLPEQLAIAAFLDRETAKIDELVEAQARLIELLKEKRQAVISHAVTKGLNPHAPMKPSGVEWLGEVPEGWEVVPVKKYLASCDGRRIPLSGEERSGKRGEFPYYGASGIIDWIDEYIFDEDLVLVSEDGANLLNRATPIAFVATGRYWVNNHAHILRPMDQSNTVFWAHAIEAIDLTPFVTGSAQPKFTAEALANLRIAVPTNEIERSAIQKHIIAETSAFDTLTAEAQRAIDLLRERRSALISAAVTGQIDVRNAVTLEVA